MSKPDYPYEYKKFEGEKDSEYDLTWTPKTIFQFAKKSLREAYEKNPNIEWFLTERSYDLWSRGLRPDQYQPLKDWAGQGYPFLIKFVESRGRVVGVTNLFPACNPGDKLDGNDAEGKPFSYNGIIFNFKADVALGAGGTGVIHWKIKEKAKKEIDEKLYSGRGDELAGGVLKGGKNVIGEYRTVSAGFNTQNIHLNPVFLLLNCETQKNLFFFKRTMPLILSQSLLDHLLKELPLSPGQKRAVTLDTRIEGGLPSQTVTEAVQRWEKFTDQELKQAIQEKLIYYTTRPNIKENANNVALLIEGCQEQKINIDINYIDIHGRSALSYAFETKHISVIESLIEFGADFCIVDKNKKMPADYNPDILEYFLKEHKWEKPENKEIFVQKYQAYQQKQSELLCRASQNRHSFTPKPVSTPTSTSTPTPAPEQRVGLI